MINANCFCFSNNRSIGNSVAFLLLISFSRSFYRCKTRCHRFAHHCFSVVMRACIFIFHEEAIKTCVCVKYSFFDSISSTTSGCLNCLESGSQQRKKKKNNPTIAPFTLRTHQHRFEPNSSRWGHSKFFEYFPLIFINYKT